MCDTCSSKLKQAKKNRYTFNFIMPIYFFRLSMQLGGQTTVFTELSSQMMQTVLPSKAPSLQTNKTLPGN
jgi:hypothetical protein